MKISFDALQQAFIEKQISIEQLIEVLIDNFGAKRTRKILRRNLLMAIEKEIKESKQA